MQKRLNRIAAEHGPGFADPDLFPHALIDDFLPPEVLEAVLVQFPGLQDFNDSTRLKLDRRLNLLIYQDKVWEEDYGGYPELWDRR